MVLKQMVIAVDEELYAQFREISEKLGFTQRYGNGTRLTSKAFENLFQCFINSQKQRYV